MADTLDRLEAGQSALLTRQPLTQARRLAFTRLGLLPGTEVVCLFRLRWGRAAVYRFCDTVLALRDSAAAQLRCKITDPGENNRASRILSCNQY